MTIIFRTAIIIVLLSLIVSDSFSQEYISGSLSGTLGPGSYIVEGDCEVENGSSLTIVPGTTFLHNGHHTWRIYGQLIAEGVEGDSIMFTWQTPSSSTRWGGIRFNPTVVNDNSMNYCIVEHCYNPSGIVGGGIYIMGNNLILANSRISDCEVVDDGGGIYAYYSTTLLVDNCLITNNFADIGGGIYLNFSNGAQVNNCIITNNESDGT